MTGDADRVRAWRPNVSGVAEVFHADWREHVYPAHTHDTWTLLLVDDGVIGYELDRHDHAAVPRAGVTLLPPHVVHDGRPATSRGFRKRVMYLDEDVIAASLIGAAVDGPSLPDDGLRRAVSALDGALVRGENLHAESRLALVVERLVWHLTGRPPMPAEPEPADLARRAREVLDDDPAAVTTITDVAASLGVSTAHLVRCFARSYGLPPHRYLLGRRLDLARHRLLAGQPPVDVARATGFYDQAHLNRHFKQLLATTPGRYQQIKNVQDRRGRHPV